MSKPIRAIVITISDRCAAGQSEDVSGKVLAGLLEEAGAEIYERLIVTDDLEHLVEILKRHSTRADLIITTGGTGLSARDNTPEATRRVIEREAPGLAEAMRNKTLENTPFAMLSRGVCGVCGKCLIINLPGSPRGVEECFAVIKPVLQHAIDQIIGNTGH